MRLLNLYGGKAVGLSGKDGLLITAEKSKAANVGLVEVTHINPEIINTLTEEGYIPVVPIGVSTAARPSISIPTIARSFGGTLKPIASIAD